MIISDLQHIESATETKVQGGCCCDDGIVYANGFRQGQSKANSNDFGVPAFPSPYNVASAGAGAQAFGTNTWTSTTTNTLVAQGQFSGSSSSSFAAAS